MGAHVLELDGVQKTYASPGAGSLAVLDGIALSVGAGDFVAVRGPSGCGKSTLLLVCGTLLRPDGGTVTIGCEDVYALSADRRARLCAERVGFVFQQFHLIPYLTVRENVLAGTVALPVADAEAKAEELIERFGLGARADHHPSQLSTGERQRTGLARALLRDPKLVLADEPTGNLDDENGRAVLEALSEFAEGGGAVLMATHDSVAAEAADRSITLDVPAAKPVPTQAAS
ncbi:MAG: ABC transporter ATP-binding protein [Planctomycetota bacterium]|jgi:ABC-type lipoprotein export system ATPase subunit